MREGDGGGLTFSFKVGLATLALFFGDAGVRYAGAGARRVTDVDVVVEVVTTVVWAMGVAVATSFLQRGSPWRQRRVRAYLVATTFYALPELPRNVAVKLYPSPRVIGVEWFSFLSIVAFVITVVAIAFLAFVPWSAFSEDGDAFRAGIARARGYRGRLSLIVLVTMSAQVLLRVSYLRFGGDNRTVPELLWILAHLALLLLVGRLWYDSEPDEAFAASEVSE